MKKKMLAFLCLATLAGCANTADDTYVDRTVDDLYNEAADLYDKGSYTSAAKTFTEVERQHPYSDWALKAQIRAGEAYFQAKKYEDAIETFNVFTELHPAHSDLAYVHYMVGMCYYEQIPTVERDQQVTELAMKSFETVIQRFPESSYAQDAQMKLDLIRNQLAGKEMAVARFYMGDGSYLAAVNRLKEVLKNFQTSSYAPEALHRLVESYLALGMKKEARSIAAVLGHNYPGSAWYQDTYELMQKFDIESAIPSEIAPEPLSVVVPEKQECDAAESESTEAAA